MKLARALEAEKIMDKITGAGPSKFTYGFTANSRYSYSRYNHATKMSDQGVFLR